jgi:glycosyltransferase involved in cell wall biosynthesis
VHDLLPVRRPEFFPPGDAAIHEKWIAALAQLDGAVCVSRTVADDMADWIDTHALLSGTSFKLGWSHSGADFGNAAPSRGLPANAEEVLSKIAGRPSFLMVGTVEPRKGHAQTLAGFEQLWLEGSEACLVIVGKSGWMVDALARKLREHPERGQRLFWLEGISDDYLDKVYAASTCLLAPSEGEGFGLPLIEAAWRKLPVLARDMPVFREVAGDHAFYFTGLAGGDVARAVNEWLRLRHENRIPLPDGIAWKSWRDSAARLLDIILGNDWHRVCSPRATSLPKPGNDDTPRYAQKQEAKAGTP